MRMVLRDNWFTYFENRILEEFGQNVRNIDNYQPDISPLVYSCLNNRRVPNKKRKVVLSSEFNDSDWSKSKDWLKLKNIIESGQDINQYMSKSLTNWNSQDYLLYTCNIRHFHLYKNKNGGIRPELVFGIFTGSSFYCLCVGDHNDIYKHERLVKIAEDNWPKELFKYNEQLNSPSSFDSKSFKNFANHPRLQINLLSPAVVKGDDGNAISSLNNNQHTTNINFTLNNITYEKIPFKAYRAYINEIEHIESIEMDIVKKYNVESIKLDVDVAQKQYVVKVLNGVPFVKKIPFKKSIICSMSHEYL